VKWYLWHSNDFEMTFEERISALNELGELIKNLEGEELEMLLRSTSNNNNWFTEQETLNALSSISGFLQKSSLEKWLSPYKLQNPKNSKNIGLLLAGNLPGVGFHDVLCVLVAGHSAHIKLSSNDKIIIPFLLNKLLVIEPRFKNFISVEEMLKAKDAYIATGSDNSARYFNYYFGKYPHIIRNNRTSVAVLNGLEDVSAIKKLGNDIFQYFGLGCRNISKIYVPNHDVLVTLLDGLESFKYVADHHKYNNNYDYNKSIYLVNKEPHLDNGFLLLRESDELVSPISVLYYSFYSEVEQLNQLLAQKENKIQCVVSNEGWFPGSLHFGLAQCPELDDYADGVDTINFLQSLI
jgi:hypothetical protein